jgi:processive 1,2-diacylglycerol beta-glucosyltransferase
MKRILILSASFGDGHNAAARSIRDALELSTASRQFESRCSPHPNPLTKGEGWGEGEETGRLHRDCPSEAITTELLDLFELASPRLNAVMKKGYQNVVRFAPALWSRVFAVFDNPKLFVPQIRSMRKTRNALGDLLRKTNPDVVVSTYPVYSHLIAELFRDRERSFRFITVITDSISVCAAWFHAPSEIFVVADEPTAAVLRDKGVPAEKIKPLGFPVSPLFASRPQNPLPVPANGERVKILYVINTGKSRAGHSLERLLEIPNLDLTITTGRNARLKTRLTHRLRNFSDRVQILGWTHEMPQLLMSHHLLIGKAGGATVQETIAAACPMIINQVIPGQEEGNARLIEMLEGGTVAKNMKEVPELVEKAFADCARQWSKWRMSLQKASRPDSAARIADLILQNCPSSAARTPVLMPTPAL